MAYAHNHAIVKVVSNHMGPHVGDCSLLSRPLHFPVPLSGMSIPCYLSSLTPASSSSGLNLYSASSWKSPISVAGWQGMSQGTNVTLWALPGYLLFSLERPWVPQGQRFMFYLGLYPQRLAHRGCSNILAELENQVLSCSSVSLRDSLYPPQASLWIHQRTCDKINEQSNPLLQGLHNVMVMD